MSVYDRASRKATAYKQERTFKLIGLQIDIVTNKILANDNLVKLLKKPVRNALAVNIEPKDRIELIKDNYINQIPMIPKEEEVKSYLIISFDNFIPNASTPKAMDYVMTIDVLCHKDLWMMDGVCPRPYLIMDELVKEFHMAKLDTWGPASFSGASNLLMNDNYMGFTMVFTMSALSTIEKKDEEDDR